MNDTSALGTEELTEKCKELMENPVVVMLMGLMAISEALPFLKKYRCNGLMHFVVTFLTALANAAAVAATPPTPPQDGRSLGPSEQRTSRRGSQPHTSRRSSNQSPGGSRRGSGGTIEEVEEGEPLQD